MKAISYLQPFDGVELAVRQKGEGIPLIWGHNLLGSIRVDDKAGILRDLKFLQMGEKDSFMRSILTGRIRKLEKEIRKGRDGRGAKEKGCPGKGCPGAMR